MKLIMFEDGRAAFKCPGCKNPHYIPTTGPQAWGWNGSTAQPTFTPSILVNVGRTNPAVHVCHSFVRAGHIEYLNDCTHKLAGQTVDLPEVNTRADLYYTGHERDDLEEG